MKALNAELNRKAYPISSMLRRIRKAIEPFPKATLFELRDQGYNSLFEQLVACVISIRTYDEVSLPSALRLFEKARTPQKLAQLEIEKIDDLIRPATFHQQKAATLKNIAQQTMEIYGGILPIDDEALQSLKGVGPKCAHLALGVAKNLPFIGVDIHVHRVTNRWGFVQAKTPEKTMVQLEERLPQKHWIEINELLVPFGKHICTAKTPLCFQCPVFDECLRIGVKLS
jgi:endonuclease-3